MVRLVNSVVPVLPRGLELGLKTYMCTVCTISSFLLLFVVNIILQVLQLFFVLHVPYFVQKFKIRFKNEYNVTSKSIMHTIPNHEC